jgi:hypothetical protein
MEKLMREEHGGHLNGMEKRKTVRKFAEWYPTRMRSKGHPKK